MSIEPQGKAYSEWYFFNGVRAGLVTKVNCTLSDYETIKLLTDFDGSASEVALEVSAVWTGNRSNLLDIKYEGYPGGNKVTFTDLPGGPRPPPNAPPPAMPPWYPGYTGRLYDFDKFKFTTGKDDSCTQATPPTPCPVSPATRTHIGPSHSRSVCSRDQALSVLGTVIMLGADLRPLAIRPQTS